MLTRMKKSLILFNLLLFALSTINANHDEYVYYPDLKIHYKLHTTPKKWIDAKIICFMENATLAKPANRDEFSVLFGLFKSIQNTEIGKKVNNMFMFLGFHDFYEEGEFVSDTGIPLQYYYHTFSNGQPDNWKNSENCVSLDINGDLNDAVCEAELLFTCQKQDVSFESKYFTNYCQNNDPEYKLEPHSGKYFKIHMHPQNWNQARRICQAENSQLAIIESKQEEDFLVNMFNNPQNRIKSGYNTYALLGFHDYYREGQFYTVTGQPLSKTKYVRWHTNQPDNHKNNEQCGSMTASGTLNDINCSTVTVFFCEKSIISIDVRAKETD